MERSQPFCLASEEKGAVTPFLEGTGWVGRGGAGAGDLAQDTPQFEGEGSQVALKWCQVSLVSLSVGSK